MSDSKVATIPVEDITVLFSSGREATWTLKPGDTCEEKVGVVVLTLSTGEVAIIQRRHVAMVQRRHRQHTIREPKPKGPFESLTLSPKAGIQEPH